MECILSTAYWPNISYFAHFVVSDEIIIEIHENYQKKSFRNRAKIDGPNGEILLSVPLLKGKNAQSKISEVQIAYHEDWHHRHWHSIQSSYGKTPYFEHYADEIKAILIDVKYDTLIAINTNILTKMLSILSISSKFIFSDRYLDSSSIYKDALVKSTSEYPQKLVYAQAFDYKRPFSPNLSILDLLFCEGPEAILYLEKYATHFNL